MGFLRKRHKSDGEQSARATGLVIEAQMDAGMAPQMRQLAADNAKRALQYVQDPKMRKLLIDQYRAAGIDVGEE